MVKVWRLIIALLGLCPSLVVSAPQLELEIDKHDIELGKHLNAQLHAYEISQSLSMIDLLPLEENFGVVIKEYISESALDSDNNTMRQTLLLKLFPRSTGDLIIPSLHFNDVYSEFVKVSVREAFEGNKTLSLSSQISATTVWERQQIIVLVEISTSQKFARLEIENSQISGLKVMPIKASREWVQTDNDLESKLRTGWIIFPLIAGKHIIELPPIKYVLNGVTERQFYLPMLSLDIKSLPPYIPPTIPVGKVELATSLPSHFFNTTDELMNWKVTLRSNVLAPQWLPAVLRQIKTNDTINFSDAESTRTLEATFDGILGKVEHNIPFKVNSSGLISMPALRIQYFDPSSGRLVSATHESKSILVISPIWLAILTIAFAGLIVFTGWALVKRLSNFIKRRNKINSAMAKIKQTHDIYDLRNSLTHYAKAVNWPENTSLSSWLHNWQMQYECDRELILWMQRLSDACYGKPQPYDFAIMRAAFINALRSPTVRKSPYAPSPKIQ